MRFLFITPKPEAKFRPPQHWLPLGFPYIGSVLKAAGHEVAIFDRYARMADLGVDVDLLDEAMLDAVRRFAPEVVGMGTVTPLIADTLRCARRVREVFGGTLLAGGHHASALPSLTLDRIPELDYVVQGEGELVMRRIGAGEDPEGIPGLWRRTLAGNAGVTPQQIEDLDALPFPDLSLFDMPFYTQRGTNMIRGHFLSTVSLLTSRGCSRRCPFCTESLTYGRGVRFHSSAYVADMAEKVLRDNPQVSGIYFHDNDFLIDRARVEELCGEFIRRGLMRRLGWAVQARVDRLDQEILTLMRRAGCIAVELGVEASTQAALDRLGKGSTVDQNLAAIRLCQAQGISVHAYMMTQVAGETVADLESRLAWLKMAAPDTFQWSPLKIYPGSLMYRDGAGKNFFETSPWTTETIRQYFDADHCSGMDPQVRSQWMQTNYEPYSIWSHRRNQLRVNSWTEWPAIAGSVVKRRLRRIGQGLGH